MRARTIGAILAAGVLLAFLGLFLLWPVFEAIRTGFFVDGKFSFYWFDRIRDDLTTRTQLLNSLLLACTTTLLCLAIAVPMALLRGRRRFWGQGLLGVAVLVPMILPPFVGAISLKRILARFGTVNLMLQQIGVLGNDAASWPDWLGPDSGAKFFVLAAIQALHLFPILYLNASAALANVDPAYGQAARNLGAGPLRTFWKVTLPLMRPGLFAGGTIVFIWSFTDIGTPLVIGFEQLTAVVVYRSIAQAETGGRIFALVFVMLSASVTLYVFGKVLFGRAMKTESSKASISEEIPRLGWLGTLGAWALFGVVTVLAVIPHIGVVLVALTTPQGWINSPLPTEYTLSNLEFVITQPQTYNSIINSLQYAGVSTMVDLVLGVATAWVLVRVRIRGRTVLDALAMLPLAVPGIILAAGYVAMTAPGEWLSAIGPTRNPFVILVIAYSVRRLPFMVRGVSAGLQQVPETLEEAARNLGASPLGAARRVTAPLILSNIIAAGVLTFAFAMLEVSDSLVLAQTPDSYPITKQIYELAAGGAPAALNQAAALGVYAMALLAGTMAIATALLGRKLGAIFRA